MGLIAAPGPPADLAELLATELVARLTELYPDVAWRLAPVTDGLVTPPAPATELVDAAHQRLLREDWELVLCLTDLPLRIGRRAVAGHASPTHRVAVVSVPALGATRVRRRAMDAAIGLVSVVLGESVPASGDGGSPEVAERVRRRLVDLAELADEDPAHGPTGLAALAGGGRLRLLGVWSAPIARGGWRLASTGRWWRRWLRSPWRASPPTSGASRPA
jgi:hypothetical protein